MEAALELPVAESGQHRMLMQAVSKLDEDYIADSLKNSGKFPALYKEAALQTRMHVLKGHKPGIPPVMPESGFGRQSGQMPSVKMDPVIAVPGEKRFIQTIYVPAARAENTRSAAGKNGYKRNDDGGWYGKLI